MKRALIVVSITVSAMLLTFVVAVLVGTLWSDDSEDLEAMILLWIFTLPGTLLVSLLGVFAYRRNATAAGLDATRWFAVLATVSLVGPILGYFLMPLLR
jgi:hypothetical protein